MDEKAQSQAPRVSGCTCMRLRKATRRVSQIYDRHLEAAGLTITQYGLLANLAGTGETTIGALAELLAMDPTTLTRNLRPLIRQGLVVHEPDRHDRRVRCVSLSATGREAFENARPLWRAAQNQINTAIGAIETSALHTQLDQVLERLAGSLAVPISVYAANGKPIMSAKVMEQLAGRPVAFGCVDLKTATSMSGLEFLRGMMSGTFPAPPIAEVLSFLLVEAEVGRAVFEGIPSDRFRNPLGTVHGGWMATILDSALGCAVHSTLKSGQGFTTVDLAVSFVRAVHESTGKLRCEAKVIHAGGRIATAEGRLVDAAGKLYAHGTTTCLVMATPAG